VNLHGACDRVIELGEAEATFFGDGAAFGGREDRVEEDHFVALSFLSSEIQDEEAKGEVDLIGGQADSFGLVHQVKHFLNHQLEGFVHFFQWFADASESGMWELDDMHGLNSNLERTPSLWLGDSRIRERVSEKLSKNRLLSF